MMSFILNAGVSVDFKPFINDKIRISNQVALLTAGVGLAYTIFSVIFYPSLTLYPVFCIVFSFGAITLNYLGMHQISRFVLSTLVILLAYLYHAFLVQPGEGFITSLYIIEFSLSVIPWVLIDIRERGLLISSLVACYALIFSQNWANTILSEELDSSLFRSGWLSYASFGFAVLISILCLLFMQKKNYLSETQNEKLLLDIQDKNKKMADQQAALERNLEEIKVSNQAEEKQNWVTKGMAEINEILRQDSGEKVYMKLLKSIIKYINANQGGLYLTTTDEDNNIFMELAACFAFEREKFMTKKVEVGQGLIGQCYLEKEIIILKEIPENYLTITSGLGDAPPKFIAIIPLIHDDLVVGVMELALFRELEKYQLDFLYNLGESIASFVSVNTLNVRTKELLAQTQSQMEQLRAQEEEMRQNMEELQATQEEMQRKEKEYISRIDELQNRDT